jgi:hypothetical protein
MSIQGSYPIGVSKAKSSEYGAGRNAWMGRGGENFERIEGERIGNQ